MPEIWFLHLSVCVFDDQIIVTSERKDQRRGVSFEIIRVCVIVVGVSRKKKKKLTSGSQMRMDLSNDPLHTNRPIRDKQVTRPLWLSIVVSDWNTLHPSTIADSTQSIKRRKKRERERSREKTNTIFPTTNLSIVVSTPYLIVYRQETVCAIDIGDTAALAHVCDRYQRNGSIESDPHEFL